MKYTTTTDVRYSLQLSNFDDLMSIVKFIINYLVSRLGTTLDQSVNQVNGGCAA